MRHVCVLVITKLEPWDGGPAVLHWYTTGLTIGSGADGSWYDVATGDPVDAPDPRAEFWWERATWHIEYQREGSDDG